MKLVVVLCQKPEAKGVQKMSFYRLCADLSQGELVGGNLPDSTFHTSSLRFTFRVYSSMLHIEQ